MRPGKRTFRREATSQEWAGAVVRATADPEHAFAEQRSATRPPVYLQHPDRIDTAPLKTSGKTPEADMCIHLKRPGCLKTCGPRRGSGAGLPLKNEWWWSRQHRRMPAQSLPSNLLQANDFCNPPGHLLSRCAKAAWLDARYFFKRTRILPECASVTLTVCSRYTRSFSIPDSSKFSLSVYILN